MPIVEGAQVALRRQYARHPDSEWVFPSERRGQPRRPDWLSLMWSRFRKKVPGMDDQGLHGLRHFFASYLLTQNVPLATVQRWMGHASQETTFIYSHDTDAGERLGLDALRGLPTP